MLVLSSEMPGPCTLDSVQLLCGSDEYDHGVFRNASVHACHTPLSELDSACADNYAGNKPAQLLARDSLSLSWKNGAWAGIGFENRFSYDGSDNLILEFCWLRDNGGSVYNLGYYTEGNRAVDAKSPTAEYGTPRNYMPRFRIFYTATGISERVAGAGAPDCSATPNPFTTATAISLPEVSGDASARIFDAGGGLVRALRRSPAAVGRPLAFRWDGRDGAGRRVGPGAYFCRVNDGRIIKLVRSN